jgi:hypothetical protein
MEFTKEDLISLSKKMQDLMQELSDYSNMAESYRIGSQLANAIGNVSDAQSCVDSAIKLMD